MDVFDLIDKFESLTYTLVTFTRDSGGRFQLTVKAADDPALVKRVKFNLLADCKNWLREEMKSQEDL